MPEKNKKNRRVSKKKRGGCRSRRGKAILRKNALYRSAGTSSATLLSG